MKINGKAKQQNVIINKSFYNVRDIEKMLENKEIFYINDEFKADFEINNINFETIFRLDLWDVNTLKIELYYGYYTNVAYAKNGKKYYIEL